MAFPTLRSSEKLLSFGSDTTDWNLTLPATIESGDLLLIVCGVDGAPTVTPDAGWTTEFIGNRGGGTPTLVVLSKVADGTEDGTTAGFTTSASERGAGGTFAFQDWSGTLSDLVVSAGTDGNSTSPNSASITGSSGDNMFLSIMAKDGSAFITGVPTNYVYDGGAGNSAGGGSGAGYGMGMRQLAAATDDPDSFTMASGEPWVSVSMIIPPAGGGGDVTAPILSNPNVTAITTTGATPRVTTDENNGSLYILQTADGADPDAATIKLETPQSVSSTGEQTGSAITGLSASTTYQVSFLHRDAAGNDSAIQRVDFTTAAASVPAITDFGDELHLDGEAGVVITGSNFEAVQGIGAVVISPTDNVNDVSAVTQTVTSWADTSITVTINRGALTPGASMFLFVTNDSGDSNASGYSTQFTFNTRFTETLENKSAAPIASEDEIVLLIWHSAPTQASPNPNQALGPLTTSGAGLIDVAITNPPAFGQDIWIALIDDDSGGSNWAGSIRRFTPTYS